MLDLVMFIIYLFRNLIIQLTNYSTDTALLVASPVIAVAITTLENAAASENHGRVKLEGPNLHELFLSIVEAATEVQYKSSGHVRPLCILHS